MLFWHRRALQLHARSLKVVANLHEKEQTAVILTFNEEVQPAEIVSSTTLALQFSDVFFTTWIKTGSGWWVEWALTLSLPYKPQVGFRSSRPVGEHLPSMQPSTKGCLRLHEHLCRL